ncbi:unnamed protein product [Brachionus calyciflorus]|uniref:Islet n=1 Tax=Brachionus calyciflorus TaxID=104777 RepID=A0A813TS79_9BILA|nr:unnamed protein product [Brachionus calyciflorus]
MPEANTVGKNQTLCMGCGLVIKDQFVLKCTPELQWHENCLKCAECDCKLRENATCFVKNGKAYCKTDYTRLFMIKCNKCGDIIKKNDLVMKAKSNIYHYNCFACNTCNKKLLPGDEYQIKDDQLYCKEDALNMSYNQGTQLYLSNLNNFQSSTMSITPETSVASSYSPSNNSSSSSIVDSPNNSSNFSYNYNPYNSGYSFMDHGNTEYHEKEDDDSVSDDDEIDDEDSNDNSISEESSLNESASSGKNKKKMFSKIHKPTFQSNFSGNSLLKVNHGSHKPARIRTVLNEKQLHTLRACYGANPRPDALMKEQLVEMTGLNPRVIRVWFQNKRCKDKKKNMLVRPDHMQQQQSQHIQIPMHHQFTNHSISNHLPQNHHNIMYDNCY